MNKKEFLKKIQENKGVLDPETINKASDSIDKLNTSIEKLKDTGVLGEDLNNDIDSWDTDRFKIEIDKLLYRFYNVTYFEDVDSKYEFHKTEALIKMSTQDAINVINTKQDNDLNTVYYNIKNSLTNIKDDENNLGTKNPLYLAYSLLKKIKLKENFVNSKIFSIIAEAETPKISKKEILKFIKK